MHRQYLSAGVNRPLAKEILRFATNNAATVCSSGDVIEYKGSKFYVNTSTDTVKRIIGIDG